MLICRSPQLRPCNPCPPPPNREHSSRPSQNGGYRQPPTLGSANPTDRLQSEAVIHRHCIWPERIHRRTSSVMPASAPRQPSPLRKQTCPVPITAAREHRRPSQRRSLNLGGMAQDDALHPTPRDKIRDRVDSLFKRMRAHGGDDPGHSVEPSSRCTIARSRCELGHPPRKHSCRDSVQDTRNACAMSEMDLARAARAVTSNEFGSYFAPGSWCGACVRAGARKGLKSLRFDLLVSMGRTNPSLVTNQDRATNLGRWNSLRTAD
jgi:hypothetical protein